MSLLKQTILCTLLIFSLLPQAWSGSVRTSDAGGDWENRKTKTIKTAKTPDSRNRFGGWAKHQVAEPGYFRVTQLGKKWWFIDPEGCLFLTVGVNSVDPDRVNTQDKNAWSLETSTLLQNAGFNTIGRWSKPQAFEKTQRQIPYCGTLGFMREYFRQHSTLNGVTREFNQTIPVFDPQWVQFCQEYAQTKTETTRDDPYLIGYFSDNELDFRPDALTRYLSLSEDDPSRQGAENWLKENKLSSSSKKNPKTQAAFLEFVAQQYFETVASALKAADPNHLYLGSRLHGRCISEPVLQASQVCDVVSINLYHHWKPERQDTSLFTKWSQRPFLVGEFYAMKVDSRRTKAEGAGFRVLKHEEAGEFYHTFTAALLKNVPNCVGWHWFKYADDFDYAQKGIVSLKGEPHQPLIEAMTILNNQAYSLRRK